MLLDAPRPGERQLAGGRVVAEQHVGHAGAFGAGQPGGDDRVGHVERFAQDQRPAGEDDEHHRDAGFLDAADHGQVVVREREIGVVAHALGVRQLAHDDDGRVGAVGVRAVGANRSRRRRRPRPARIAARIVVPPVVTSPALPCHSMVQPPH